jgi:hypothetical protein
MTSNVFATVAFLVFLGASTSAFGARITCESRNFQRNYCSTGERISNVRLVYQQSKASCIQGRTWGYDDRGIWVTEGCSAEFDFRRSGSDHGGRRIACASRGYDRQFCPSDRRIARAWLVEQRSRAACMQGRTWGFQDDGIWVSEGCNGVFEVEERRLPSGDRVACESRGFDYAFCAVGPEIRRAWIHEQRSRSPCIQGRSWGFQRNGIWVDKGCSAVFAFEVR